MSIEFHVIIVFCHFGVFMPLNRQKGEDSVSTVVDPTSQEERVTAIHGQEGMCLETQDALDHSYRSHVQQTLTRRNSENSS